MHIAKLSALLTAATMLQACSSFPSPEDIVSTNGDGISKITRCQAIKGVKDLTVETAHAFGDTPLYGKLTGRQFAAWLRADEDNFGKIEWSKFKGDGGKTFNFYRPTIVAYDFTIEAAEGNTVGVDLTLVRAFSKGANAFGFGVNNERSRAVKDHWTENDTFASLLSRRASFCRNVPETANMFFPATGLTRIEELPRRFTFRNQARNLSSKDDPKIGLVDTTITFKTKSGAKVNPVFTLPAAQSNLIATEIKPSLNVSREDNHTIIILIKQSDGTSGPRFDRYGRITAMSAAEERKRDLEDDFDRIRSRNAEDAIKQIGTTLSGF